jgi:hypothetical protein
LGTVSSGWNESRMAAKLGTTRTRSFMRIAFIAVLLWLTGCVTYSSKQTIVAYNASSHVVHDFALEDPRGQSFSFGWLGPGATADYGGRMAARSRDIFRASWKDALNQLHEARIDLHKEMPAGIEGDVVFVLNEDGTVSAKRWKAGHIQ